MATGDPALHGTVSSTALTLLTFDTGFSAAQIALARAIIVTVADDNIRFLTNGDTPTATDGHLMTSGQSYVLRSGKGDNPRDISMIRETADAQVTIQLVTNNDF